MTPSILILTQEMTGNHLIQPLHLHFSTLNYDVCAVSLNNEASSQVFQPYIEKRLASLDLGAGVLILTDLPFSLSDKIARDIAQLHNDYCVVSGVNLPMLFGLLATEGLTVNELKALAIKAGREGIF